MSFGLREAVIGLIVLVAAYMLFVLLRMRRLNEGEAASAADAWEPGEVPAFDASAEPLATPAPTLDELLREPLEPAVVRRSERERVSPAPVAGMPRAEVEALLARLYEEIAVLRNEIHVLRQELGEDLAQFRATQSVSPLYNDAMQMALAGYSALMIAERCGIARAEAEMVVGLARSQQGDLANG